MENKKQQREDKDASSNLHIKSTAMKTANILWRDLLRQVRLFPLAVLFTALPLAAQVPSLINY
jgi:hypothetical protein